MILDRFHKKQDKPCWTERWNNFAKKSIYINHHFQISCGRLVFTTILILIQCLGIISITGSIAACFTSLSTYLATFQKKVEKECKEEEEKKDLSIE